MWLVLFLLGLAVVLWRATKDPVWFTMGGCYVYFAVPMEEFFAPTFKYQAVLFAGAVAGGAMMYPDLFDRWARADITEAARRMGHLAIARAKKAMSEVLISTGMRPDNRQGAIQAAMLQAGRDEARRVLEDEGTPALNPIVMTAVDRTLEKASGRAEESVSALKGRMRRAPPSTADAILRGEVVESFEEHATDGLDERLNQRLEKAFEDEEPTRSRSEGEGPLGIPQPVSSMAGIFTNVGVWLHIVFIILTYIGAQIAIYDPDASLDKFEVARLLLIPIFGILAGVRTPRHFFMFVLAWCFGVWHICMNGVTYWLQYGGRADNAGGQGGEANFLGGIIVSVIPVMFGLTLNLKVLWQRLAALGTAGCYTLGVLASGSRAGFLALGMALGYWVLHTNRRMIAVGVMLMAGSGFLVAAPESFWERMGTIVGMRGDNQWVENPAEPSAGSRIVLWNLAFDIWKRHPVMGIGPYNYMEVSAEETTFVDAYEGKRGLQAHNTWLQLLAEYGTVGSIVWGGSFFLALYLFRRARKKMRQYEGMEWFCAICLGLEAGGIGTAAILMFNSFQWYDYLYWYMVSGPLALSIASRHAERLDWLKPAPREDDRLPAPLP